MYQTKAPQNSNQAINGTIKFTNADYYYQTLTQFFLDFVDRLDVGNITGAITRFRFIYAYTKPFILSGMTPEDIKLLSDYTEIKEKLSQMGKGDYDLVIKKNNDLIFEIQELMFIKVEKQIEYMAKNQLLLPIMANMPDVPSGLLTSDA